MSAALQMAQQVVGGGHPSLDLNFLAGAWPAGLSFSRASGATVNCWARYDQRAPSGGFFGGLADWLVGGFASLAFAGNTVTVTHTGSTYAGLATSASLLEAGKVYRITVNITANSAGRTVQIAHQGVAGLASINSTGLLQATYRPATTGRLAIEFTTDAITGNSFTASTLMLEELTLWQPGMDWLGPELAVSFCGSLHASLSAPAAGVAKVTATGVDPYYEYDVTGSGVVGGRTYIFTVDAWTDVGQPPPSALYAYSFPFAEPQSVGIPPTFVRTSSQLSFSFSAARSETAMIVRADGAKNAVGSYFYVAAPRVREQLYTLQNVLLPANVPRIAYDPVTGACLGAMVEPQRTNLLDQTEKWVGPSSSVSGVSWTVASQVIAGVRVYDFAYTGTPDGPYSVPFGIVCASGLTPASAGVKYYHSANIKRLSGNHGLIYMPLVWENAAAEYLGQTNGPTIDGITQTQYEGNDPLVSPTGTATIRLGFGLTDLTIGAPISGVLRVSELQIEVGTERTSYIPTAGAAATRAQDVAPQSVVNLLASAGTLVFEMLLPRMPGSYPGVCLRSAVVGQNCFGLYLNGGTGNALQGMNLLLRVSSSTVHDLYLGDVASQATVKKVAITWTPSSFMAVQNGGAATVRTGPSFPVVSVLDLVALDNPCNGGHVRTRYYPRTMTAAELQAVTK